MLKEGGGPPGDPEEPVELDELDELEGFVVVEVDGLHAHAQVGGLGLNYPCTILRRYALSHWWNWYAGGGTILCAL